MAAIRIDVANLRTLSSIDRPFAVYCGRNPIRDMSREWHLRNQHRLTHPAERAIAIDRFVDDFVRALERHDPQISSALTRLEERATRDDRVVLVCHCAPLACHCDALAVSLKHVLTRNGHDVTCDPDVEQRGDAYLPRLGPGLDAINQHRASPTQRADERQPQTEQTRGRIAAKDPDLLATCIGSRTISSDPDLVRSCELIGRALATAGFTAVSGCADGADSAFQRGAGEEHLIAYLPWNGFTGDGRRYEANGQNYRLLNAQAMLRAEAASSQLHPNPSALKSKRGARALHARNCAQVFGPALDQPTSLCLAMAPIVGHSVSGGTRTAFELARRAHIPLYRLLDERERQEFLAQLGRWRSGEDALPTRPPKLTIEVALGIEPRNILLMGTKDIDPLRVMKCLDEHEIAYVVDARSSQSQSSGIIDLLKPSRMKYVPMRSALGDLTFDEHGRFARDAHEAYSPYQSEMRRLAAGAASHRIAIIGDEPDPRRSHLSLVLGTTFAGLGIQPHILVPDTQSVLTYPDLLHELARESPTPRASVRALLAHADRALDELRDDRADSRPDRPEAWQTTFPGIHPGTLEFNHSR